MGFIQRIRNELDSVPCSNDFINLALRFLIGQVVHFHVILVTVSQVSLSISARGWLNRHYSCNVPSKSVVTGDLP